MTPAIRAVALQQICAIFRQRRQRPNAREQLHYWVRIARLSELKHHVHATRGVAADPEGRGKAGPHFATTPISGA